MHISLHPERLVRSALLLFWGMLLWGTAWGQAAPEPDSPQRPVIVASIPHLIRKPAHLFGLNGKTLRFLPQSGGGYRVQIRSTAELAPSPNALSSNEVLTGQRQKLPFAFPFGGKTWTELYVNLSGSLSFGRSEREVADERPAWAGGGMLSMAAALDERSASGQEALIAALWAANDTNGDTWRISTGSEADRFVVTWEVQRVPWGHAVEGRNRFQVRLSPDGVIEMAYPDIVRQDGIVGLFPGVLPSTILLDHVAGPAAASAMGAEVEAMDVFDAGTALEFVFTLRQDVPLHREQGRQTFYIRVEDDVARVQGWLTLADRISCYADVDADPRTIGYQVHGRTVAMFVSKTRLVHPNSWRWSASVERAEDGKTEATAVVPEQKPRRVRMQANGNEQPLTKPEAPWTSNLFEVFHYPWVTKESRPLLKSLYAHLPAEDDFAVVFTDFRIDDLFAQGPSTGALNLPIQGIGEGPASPQSTRDLGFSRLQVTPATVWIGAPFFSEQGPDEGGIAYHHFARGVAWLAHELSHRWGQELRFRNPQTGKTEPLATPSGHWLPDLYAPAMVTDTTGFPSGPAISFSIMAEGRGTEWRTNPDGTFQRRFTPWWRNPGFSALDLYVMGLLPPEQVPDTFLMQNIQPVTPERLPADGWLSPVTATRVPVRIQDIVAAMGPRNPAAAHTQKEFRLGIYLIPSPGKKVDPAMLDRANRLAIALADFFETATGHRITMRFSQ
ncbi:MAG TPA: hypothetical protein VKU00_30775 [Chthonomonadaceae bacterium]|nr:hypothetical protein [Chthonomonadaceae bacterium]